MLSSGVCKHYSAVGDLLNWLLAFFPFRSGYLPDSSPLLHLLPQPGSQYPVKTYTGLLASFYSWPPWGMPRHSLQPLGSKVHHFWPVSSLILCLHRQLPHAGKEGQRATCSDIQTGTLLVGMVLQDCYDFPVQSTLP